jgi:hypothetical protein
MITPKNKGRGRIEMACIPCLYACGFGCKVIGKQLGYGHESVFKVLKRNGLEIRGASERNKTHARRRGKNPEARIQMRAQWQAEWKGVVEDYSRWHPATRKSAMSWYYSNIEKARERGRKNAKIQWEKRKSDPCFRLKARVACHIWKALHLKAGQRKPERTVQLIGCSLEQFKLHIESQFKDGMTWANIGQWELDHIIPQSHFRLTKPEQRRQCFHWSNYQPLWRRDNRTKWAKVLKQAQLL